MRKARFSKPFAVFCFIAALLAGLAHPSPASAHEKRGARIVVTKADGYKVEGEILAVRQDSLLLLGFAGREETVDIADIVSVRIVRKSHLGTLVLGGLAAGAVGGAIYGGTVGDDVFEKPSLAVGVIFGTLGALAGLTASLPLGADSTFPIAGEPVEVMRSRLDALARHSREYRNLRPRGPSSIEVHVRPSEAPESVRAPSQVSFPRPERDPKFRLALGSMMNISRRWAPVPSEEGSFRFQGDVPPAEAGPHPVDFTHRGRMGMWTNFFLNTFSLAYDWKKRWTAEIEFFAADKWPYEGSHGTLRFTSTLDGKTYVHRFDIYRSARFDSVLVGLNYRPIAPSLFDRHIFEAGFAVGPALVKIVPSEETPYLEMEKKISLTARVQAAYDFYVVPHFFVGACVGYRYLHAAVRGSTITTELEFAEEGVLEYLATNLTRLTEVSTPGQTFSRSTILVTLRAGIRF